MITIWKLAPAIAAGNALIIKTPELASLYAQKLASLIKEVGSPMVFWLSCVALAQLLARHWPSTVGSRILHSRGAPPSAVRYCEL